VSAVPTCIPYQTTLKLVYPLHFLTFYNFIGRWGLKGQDTSSCQISSNQSIHCGDIAISKFSQTGSHPPSWISGVHIGTPTGSPYHCAIFGWNPCSSIYNTKLWIFYIFGLIMAIHAPKMFFWGRGGFDPLNGEQYQCNRQKAQYFMERRHIMHRYSKLVHQCNLCVWQRNQKKTDKEL